jgi:O-antigen/teichoic acid export membrane protein
LSDILGALLGRYGAGKAKRPKTNSQLRKNMVVSAGLTGLGAAISAISYPLYLSKLGYETYGLWLVLSTVLSFSQVSNLGMAQALTKYIAEHRDDKAAIKEYTSTAMAFTICASVVLWILSLLCRDAIIGSLHLKSEYVATTTSLLPMLVLFSGYLFCVDVTNNVLNGLGRLDLCVSCQILAQVLALILSLCWIYNGRGVSGMFLGNCVGYVIAHSCSIALCRRYLKILPFDVRSIKRERGRQLISFGGWMMSTTVLGLLLNPFNRLLIGKFGSLSDVPVYDMAYNMAFRMRNLFEVTQRSLTAEVSRIGSVAGQERSETLRRLYQKCLKLVASAGPLFLLLGLGIEPIARLWLGRRFEPQVIPAMRIMLLGAFCSLLGTPAFYVLLGLGRSRQVFIANAIQSGINAGLALALVMVGVRLNALSVASAVAVGMMAAAFYLFRYPSAARLI